MYKHTVVLCSRQLIGSKYSDIVPLQPNLSNAKRLVLGASGEAIANAAEVEGAGVHPNDNHNNSDSSNDTKSMDGLLVSKRNKAINRKTSAEIVREAKSILTGGGTQPAAGMKYDGSYKATGSH